MVADAAPRCQVDQKSVERLEDGRQQPDARSGKPCPDVKRDDDRSGGEEEAGQPHGEFMYGEDFH